MNDRRDHAVVIGASMGGLAAAAALARGPLDARKFFAKAHRIEDVAWKISTGGDLRYDAVEGKRTPEMKIMNRYLDRLTRGAQTDPVLAAQFLLVAGFIERPESFFKPSIVWRVLRSGGQSGAAAMASAPQPSDERVAPGLV